MTNKQTPLTLENFEKILPILERSLLPKVDISIKAELKKFKYDIDENFKKLEEKIDHLPSKKQYFAREDKTMNELKKLREEVALTKHHYEKTNKRVDTIDKHLGMDTSTVF